MKVCDMTPPPAARPEYAARLYRNTASLYERFWSKVAIAGPDECWHWTAATPKAGYGRIFAGKTLGGPAVWLAPRVAYVLAVGPIPDGAELDHACHSRDPGCVPGPACPHRRCVNPAHLEPVTHQENAVRREERVPLRKCGHPRSDRVRNGRGWRCRTCNQLRNRVSRQKKETP